jgi:hypothetical protein
VNCDLVDCEDSSEDDDKDDEDDLEYSSEGATDRFYIHEHDEFMVQGLIVIVNVTEFYDL